MNIKVIFFSIPIQEEPIPVEIFNPEENPDLFEGDIILSDEQKMALASRKLVTFTSQLWLSEISSGGILYTMTGK